MAKKLVIAFAPLVVVLFLFTSMLTDPPHAASIDHSSAFGRLVDRYFDLNFQFHPSDGTAAGVHQYDSKLEDYSRAAQEGEAAKLKVVLSELAGTKASALDPADAADCAFLQSTIRSRLLELQVIQMWRKDPNIYAGGVTSSVFTLIKRNFASPEDRLRSVIAREKQIPAALIVGRQNLLNPPRIYTEIALEQMPDIIEFFQKDVPGAFSAVTDPTLREQFSETNEAVIEALGSFQTYLKNDLLSKSHGDFRIGAENFRQKLRDDEMVDVPLDRLLEIGYADLRRNQQRLQETAALVNPEEKSRAVMTELEKDHPPADGLLPAFRDLLAGLRDFIEARQIVTIPSPVVPILEETPPFMRATTSASMDTPGAYESRATEAMFNVTLPEPGWPAERVEDWMRGYNRGTILSTAIHETYPGHYVQFLWLQRLHSKVRKLLVCNSNAEGWAHYTEQMMLDEGYGGGDPKLRMGQLQDALLRDARFIVGIQMHTGRMTLDEAKQFFVREGYQVDSIAEIEAKRGTSDPTYLYYTLGKLQIMKLRDDYKKKMGAQYSLREFHDRLMGQGGLPLVLIRRALLGDNSPSL